MKLRKGPGLYLDKVDLRRESFIIERAGKAKAALVPLSELEQLERVREQARERLQVKSVKVRARVARVGLPPQEINKRIDQAIKEVRRERREALTP